MSYSAPDSRLPQQKATLLWSYEQWYQGTGDASFMQALSELGPNACREHALHVNQTVISIYITWALLHGITVYFLPSMVPAFLFGFAVCFSLGLLLSGILAYIDTRDQLSSKSRLLGNDYRWERAFDIMLGIIQMCLLIGGIVVIVAASRSSREGCNWLEMGVMCYLQLAVGTNVRTSALWVWNC